LQIPDHVARDKPPLLGIAHQSTPTALRKRGPPINTASPAAKTPVVIPILPELQAVIDASPIGDLAFIAQPDGRPLAANSFSNWFRDACKMAMTPEERNRLDALLNSEDDRVVFIRPDGSVSEGDLADGMLFPVVICH
jgi:hypothetical protein